MPRATNLPLAEIGRRIKQIRGSLTLKNFSEKIGFDASMIHHVEKGKTLPGPEMLLRVAEYSGTSIEWLLTGKTRYPADRARESAEEHYRKADANADRVLRAIRGFSPEEIEHLLEYIKLIKRRRKSMPKE